MNAYRRISVWQRVYSLLQGPRTWVGPAHGVTGSSLLPRLRAVSSLFATLGWHVMRALTVSVGP